MRKKSSVITPPPQIEEKSETTPAFSEGHREALLKLVRKGAPSIPPVDGQDDHNKGDGKQIKFTLRLSRVLAERIKNAAAEQPVNMPINTWVTEAVLERLRKEGF